MSELHDQRLDRLEQDMREVKFVLGRLEPMITGIAAQLPHFATKADLADLRNELHRELADKPGKLYMWGILGALFAGQAVILAAAALLPKLL